MVQWLGAGPVIIATSPRARTCVHRDRTQLTSNLAVCFSLVSAAAIWTIYRVHCTPRTHAPSTRVERNRRVSFGASGCVIYAKQAVESVQCSPKNAADVTMTPCSCVHAPCEKNTCSCIQQKNCARGALNDTVNVSVDYGCEMPTARLNTLRFRDKCPK